MPNIHNARIHKLSSAASVPRSLGTNAESDPARFAEYSAQNIRMRHTALERKKARDKKEKDNKAEERKKTREAKKHGKPESRPEKGKV